MYNGVHRVRPTDSQTSGHHRAGDETAPSSDRTDCVGPGEEKDKQLASAGTTEAGTRASPVEVTALGRAIGQGAAANLLVTGVGNLLQPLVLLTLARLMRLEEFGSFVFASSLLAVFGLVGRLGFDTAAVRFVATYRVRRQWSSLRGFRCFSDATVLATSLFIAVLLAATVWGLGTSLPDGLAGTLLVGCLLLPVSGLEALRAAYLQALKRVALAPLPGLVYRPLLLASSALFLFLRPGFAGLTSATIMACQVFATTGAVISGSLLVRASLPPEVATNRPDYSPRRLWARTAVPLSFVSGLKVVLNRTDILVVGSLLGPAEAGIYAVATRLAQVVSMGLSVANSISMPMVAELHTLERRDSLQRLLNLTTTATSLWSLITTAILITGASFFLGIFGPEFERGAAVLRFLALGQFVNGATGPVGTLLNMTGHERENARMLACVVGINLLLSIPAVSGFGPMGAAAVTSGLIATKNLWTLRVVKRRLGVSAVLLGTRTEQ